MEEKFLVFEDNLHEYDIIVTKPDSKTTVYSLYTSNAEHWSEGNKEKFKLSLTDNGNDIVCSKAVKTFNYSQWGELRILTNFEHSYSTKGTDHAGNTKIMKVETLITF